MPEDAACRSKLQYISCTNTYGKFWKVDGDPPLEMPDAGSVEAAALFAALPGLRLFRSTIADLPAVVWQRSVRESPSAQPSITQVNDEDGTFPTTDNDIIDLLDEIE